MTSDGQPRTLRAEAFQFFSRASFPLGPLATLRTSSQERPDVVFELAIEYIDRPFELSFAHLVPRGHTIGAIEYTDPDDECYLGRRWPVCLKATGSVAIPAGLTDSDQLYVELLTYLRVFLWGGWRPTGDLLVPADQRASLVGYRREFFHLQGFDLFRRRRSSDFRGYTPSELGEPIGPGVATFPERMTDPNEFVWSPIHSFPGRSSFDQDKPALKRALASQWIHRNSHNELVDAARLLDQKEIRAAVRSAASVVDAILNYYIAAWGLKQPSGVPFDDKIEEILLAAGKPSYRQLEPRNSKQLLYLYRSRNSMHEADCYYKSDSGQTVLIREPVQVEEFIKAATQFLVWIDALV